MIQNCMSKLCLFFLDGEINWLTTTVKNPMLGSLSDRALSISKGSKRSMASSTKGLLTMVTEVGDEVDVWSALSETTTYVVQKEFDQLIVNRDFS